MYKRQALLNYKDLVDDYLQINDWRVKENSTVTYSVEMCIRDRCWTGWP